MNLFHNRPLFTAVISFLITAVISVKIIFYKHLFLTFTVAIFAALIASIIIKLSKKTNGRSHATNTLILSLLLSLIAATSQYLYFTDCFTTEAPISEATVKATVKEITYEGDNFCYFIAQAHTVNNKKVNNNFKFEYFGKQKITVGDNFTCVGNVYPYANDGISPSESFDFSKGATATVTDILAIKKTSAEKYSLLRFLYNVRSYTQAKIISEKNYDGKTLIVSLLLGKTDTLNSNIYSDFKALGITHILAISGMHISILAFGVQYLLVRLNVSKRLRIFILLAIVLFYIGISGMAASAVRAALMLLTVSLSLFIRRDTDSVTSLSLAVSAIILVQPYAIFDIGLWLSFLATFGVITALQFIEKRRCTLFSKVFNKIVDYTKASLMITLFVFIFTLPVICFVFGYISSLTPVSNLVFSILTEILMYMSFLIPVFLFSEFYINICASFANIIILLVDKIADFPYAIVSVCYPVFIIAMLIFSGYVFFLISKKKNAQDNILKKFLIASSLLISVLVGCTIYSNTITASHYISSDDNTSEYIISQNHGEVTVFDLSDASNSAKRCISDSTYKNKINKIDNYVLCHYLSKYTDLIDELNSFVKIERVFLPYPENEEDYEIALRIIETLEKLDVKIETYRKNERIKCDNMQYILNDVGSKKHSNVLHIKSKNTVISYISPHAASEMEDYEISDELAFSDVIIIGKHGGKNNKVMYFSFPEEISHIIFADEDAEITEDFANAVRSVKKFSIFESTKINIK